MGITGAKNQSASALAELMVLFVQGLCTEISMLKWKKQYTNQ
jgi:hypothetical protein